MLRDLAFFGIGGGLGVLIGVCAGVWMERQAEQERLDRIHRYREENSW